MESKIAKYTDFLIELKRQRDELKELEAEISKILALLLKRKENGAMLEGEEKYLEEERERLTQCQQDIRDCNQEISDIQTKLDKESDKRLGKIGKRR